MRSRQASEGGAFGRPRARTRRGVAFEVGTGAAAGTKPAAETDASTSRKRRVARESPPIRLRSFDRELHPADSSGATGERGTGDSAALGLGTTVADRPSRACPGGIPHHLHVTIGAGIRSVEQRCGDAVIEECRIAECRRIHRTDAPTVERGLHVRLPRPVQSAAASGGKVGRDSLRADRGREERGVCGGGLYGIVGRTGSRVRVEGTRDHESSDIADVGASGWCSDAGDFRQCGPRVPWPKQLSGVRPRNRFRSLRCGEAGPLRRRARACSGRTVGAGASRLDRAPWSDPSGSAVYVAERGARCPGGIHRHSRTHHLARERAQPARGGACRALSAERPPAGSHRRTRRPARLPARSGVRRSGRLAGRPHDGRHRGDRVVPIPAMGDSSATPEAATRHISCKVPMSCWRSARVWTIVRRPSGRPSPRVR